MRHVDLRLRTTLTHDLNGGAMSDTWSPNCMGEILAVDVHFGASNSETITITRDSIDGAAYDTVIKAHTMSSAADYTWEPAIPRPFAKGDIIKVEVTAAAATCVVSFTIFYRQLSIVPSGI